jgi:hypothetical protein
MVDPDELPEIAQANLQRLVKTALPDGRFVFGGMYSSPSPHAERKRQRDHVSDIIVKSNGSWIDNATRDAGSDIIGLLAHLQLVNRGVVIGQLAQRLQPVDRMSDRVILRKRG